MEEVKTGVAASVISKIWEGMGGWETKHLADRVLDPVKSAPTTIYSILLPKTAARLREVVYSSASKPEVREAALAMAEAMLLARLEKKTGIRLESLDERGLARAIGRRVGIELNSLHELDIIEADLMRIAVERIEMAMDWAFGGVIKTIDDLIDQLLKRAATEIERRVPGLVLHDISDPQAVADDVLRWVAKRIRDKTGIPFRDFSDPQATKEDVLRWARPEIEKRLGKTGLQGGRLRMTRRAVDNRAAQLKFYRTHGRRHVYRSIYEKM